MSNEEFESFEPDLISLLDEDGNEYEFEILDEIDFKDSHFYALMPLFDLPEQDIESENTYMIFEAIEDDALIDELAEIFESRFDEAYDEDIESNDE